MKVGKNSIHSTMSGFEAWLLKVSKYIYKTFKRTDHSLKLYLKQKKTSIFYLFKNLLSL